MKIGRFKLLERRVIGGADDPLMLRWIVLRVPAIGIYVHKFCRSDYDRALHDHPWPFVAIILKGGYTEVHDQTNDQLCIGERRKPGDVLLRPAQWRHRVMLDIDYENSRESLEKEQYFPSWSLVFVGRRARKWGFWLPDGWCWWRKHDGEKNICEEEIIHENGED